MKIFIRTFLALSVFICGCDTSGVDHRTLNMKYRAVDKTDTALLHISITDSQFKGQFEIKYHGTVKDSGEVSGYVKGDTLVGNFLFQHYGMELKHRIPIALLNRDHKLIMGIGAMEIYLQRTYFKKNVPIDYKNVKFIFEPIN